MARRTSRLASPVEGAGTHSLLACCALAWLAAAREVVEDATVEVRTALSAAVVAAARPDAAGAAAAARRGELVGSMQLFVGGYVGDALEMAMVAMQCVAAREARCASADAFGELLPTLVRAAPGITDGFGQGYVWTGGVDGAPPAPLSRSPSSSAGRGPSPWAPPPAGGAGATASAAASRAPPPRIMGWLEKLSQGGRWQRRWVTVSVAEGAIWYHSAPQDGPPSACYPLRHASLMELPPESIVDAVAHSRPSSWRAHPLRRPAKAERRLWLHCRSADPKVPPRDLVLRAPTPEVCAQWEEVLLEGTRRARGEPEPPVRAAELRALVALALAFATGRREDHRRVVHAVGGPSDDGEEAGGFGGIRAVDPAAGRVVDGAGRGAGVPGPAGDPASLIAGPAGGFPSFAAGQARGRGAGAPLAGSEGGEESLSGRAATPVDGNDDADSLVEAVRGCGGAGGNTPLRGGSAVDLGAVDLVLSGGASDGARRDDDDSVVDARHFCGEESGCEIHPVGSLGSGAAAVALDDLELECIEAAKALLLGHPEASSGSEQSIESDAWADGHGRVAGRTTWSEDAERPDARIVWVEGLGMEAARDALGLDAERSLDSTAGHGGALEARPRSSNDPSKSFTDPDDDPFARSLPSSDASAPSACRAERSARSLGVTDASAASLRSPSMDASSLVGVASSSLPTFGESFKASPEFSNDSVAPGVVDAWCEAEGAAAGHETADWTLQEPSGEPSGVELLPEGSALSDAADGDLDAAEPAPHAVPEALARVAEERASEPPNKVERAALEAMMPRVRECALAMRSKIVPLLSRASSEAFRRALTPLADMHRVG